MYTYFCIQQLWTVALCLTQSMGKLIPLEQHLDRQPSTVVTQATDWLETVLALVKLQECGLGVHLPVEVCCYYMTRGMHVQCYRGQARVG